MNRSRPAPSLLAIPAVLLFVAMTFFGCGSSKDGRICPNGLLSCGQRCAGDMPPAACDQVCDASTPCPAGFYCGGDGTCTSDCLVAGDEFCPDGLCTADGMCVPMPDAGPSPDGDVDAGPDACARQSVNATAVTPNVIFIIDRSGSMEWELDLTTCGIGAGMCTGGAHTYCPGGTNPGGVDCDCSGGNQDCYAAGLEQYSRWRELRATLVGTTAAPAMEGLVADLQDQVRFGAVLYNRGGAGNCYQTRNLTPVTELAVDYLGVIDVGVVPSARDVIAGNGTNDNQYLNQDPSGGTPTGAAIDWTLANLAPSILASSDPTIFILATDGNPTDDTDCQSHPNYDAPEAWSVAAVQRAEAANIRTFVLAVADESELNQAHVDDLANAGVGNALGTVPAAESWRITSVAALNAALQQIIQGEISCTVNLQGSVPDWASDPCSGGMVEFVEGATRTPVACSASNGWQLTSATTLELYGTSCDTLQNTPGLTLEASFPCGTVILNPD